MSLVPFYSGIGILGILTIYQYHLARTFTGNFKDKLYYYFSHINTIIPIILYMFVILQNTITNAPIQLDIFYVDWSITTPIMLINLGRIANIPVAHSLFVTLIDNAMILCGYVSYLSNNNILTYTMYVIGCICYISLNAMFIGKFRRFQKTPRSAYPPTSIYRDSVRYRIYRALIASIACSWVLYPIAHMLWKQGILSTSDAVITYVCLDVTTKGIYTNLMLGAREIYRVPTSWLGWFTKKVFQIHPLEINVSDNDLADSIEMHRTKMPASDAPNIILGNTEHKFIQMPRNSRSSSVVEIMESIPESPTIITT